MCAVPVIDVDTHYYEPFSWLADTDPQLAAALPPTDKVTLVVTTAFGEVLSTRPPELKPDPLSRVPKELMGEATELTPELIERGEMLLEFDPIARVIDEGGEGIVVFASDYPHPEGGSDAVAGQAAKLADSVSAEAREGFFGGTVAQDLALTA